MYSGILSGRPLSVNAYITLHTLAGFEQNLTQIFVTQVDIAYKFSRSEVKGQGHDQRKCCIGGGMHFDSTASNLTSFIFFTYFLYVTRSCAAVKWNRS